MPYQAPPDDDHVDDFDDDEEEEEEDVEEIEEEEEVEPEDVEEIQLEDEDDGDDEDNGDKEEKKGPERAVDDSENPEAPIEGGNEDDVQKYEEDLLEDVKSANSIPEKSAATEANYELGPTVENNGKIYPEVHSNPECQVDNTDMGEGYSGKEPVDPKMAYLENRADCRNMKHDVSVKLLSQNLENLEELNVLSSRRQPRIASVDVPDSISKKSAIICSFFAKGWCIKGSSCRFLHEKEAPVDIGERSKGGISIPDQTDSLDDHRGKLGDTEVSNHSVLYKPLETSNSQRSEKSGLELQSYGRDTSALSKVICDKSNHESDISTKFSYKSLLSHHPGYDKQLKLFSSEEYGRKSGTRSYHDFNSDKLSDGQEFASRPYLGEGKFYQETNKGDILSNSSFSRLSSWSSDPSVPGYIYRSGSSAETGLGSNSSYSYKGKLDDLFSRYQTRSFTLDGSCNPLWDSKSVHVSTDLPSSAGLRLGSLESSWELSAPFRSSFCAAPGSISSSSSQLDPLVNSTLPSKLGRTASVSASSKDYIHNFTSKQDDPSLSDEFSPGFSAQKPPRIFPQSNETVLDTTSPHGYSGHASVAAGHGSSTMDSRDSNTSENKKRRASDLTYGVKNITDINISSKLRNLEDKGKDSDDPKEVKMFRVSLVEYLKELIKPSWKDGVISKDAHKVILIKASEKVIGSMPLHQVPSTGESIEQYLSTSHSKLKNLVEGYVNMYRSISQG